MSNNRYPEEFKIEAVRQITDKGYSVADVSRRLDVSVHSLYAWLSDFDRLIGFAHSAKES